MSSSKPPELRALTGIRAIAAIIVVLSHIGVPPTAWPWLYRTVASGYIGVHIFFVLSGFVLGYNYATINPTSFRQLGRFYLARVARVLPLYYAVLAFMAIRLESVQAEQDLLLPSLLNIQTWSPDVDVAMSGYNPPAWSINVELFFYLLFPLLMPAVAFLARRTGVRGLLIAIGTMIALQWVLVIWFSVMGWADLPIQDPTSGHRWLYRNPLPRLLEFGIGLSLAMLHRQHPLGRLTPRLHSLLQLGAVVVMVTLTIVRPWEGPSAGLWRAASYGALYSLPTVVLLASLASSKGVVARFLSMRVMLSLGASSYALYLTHRPFLDNFGGVFVRSSENWAGWVLIPLLVMFTLVIGEGAHRLIERPCHRWLRGLIGPRKPRREPPTAA